MRTFIQLEESFQRNYKATYVAVESIRAIHIEEPKPGLPEWRVYVDLEGRGINADLWFTADASATKEKVEAMIEAKLSGNDSLETGLNWKKRRPYKGKPPLTDQV